MTGNWILAVLLAFAHLFDHFSPMTKPPAKAVCEPASVCRAVQVTSHDAATTYDAQTAPSCPADGRPFCFRDQAMDPFVGVDLYELVPLDAQKALAN